MADLPQRHPRQAARRAENRRHSDHQARGRGGVRHHDHPGHHRAAHGEVHHDAGQHRVPAAVGVHAADRRAVPAGNPLLHRRGLHLNDPRPAGQPGGAPDRRGGRGQPLHRPGAHRAAEERAGGEREHGLQRAQEPNAGGPGDPRRRAGGQVVRLRLRDRLRGPQGLSPRHPLRGEDLREGISADRGGAGRRRVPPHHVALLHPSGAPRGSPSTRRASSRTGRSRSRRSPTPSRRPSTTC